ncbi:molybdopterin-dependent oxidoreductase [Saliterribacillus persicus]|uniref:Molybdopterin-dependent oxidoreductase-like protein n=1 Tax=Saliterribacillus persicus TaxID=930114 RepID=A0A368YFH1_9BACI|nr:molybdopterin-dependent oxidoreductase [Saliterribacillus persicus]RCW76934.1 molybdopterin-dependent oxidoreductase-like protein [Saliterribacillus persicus]
MDIKVFFQRNLNVGKKLVRLHHSNAILFFLLSLTGLLLLSAAFRSTFPATRVWIKDIHIWIGVISVLPLLFYLPKRKKHQLTIRKAKYKQLNLKLVISILLVLMVSGFLLTFHRQFPPTVSSWALIIHDLATWVGLPYVIYHSLTRTQTFKKLEKRFRKKSLVEKPMEIEDGNPVYKRRSFLRILLGGFIVLVSSHYFIKWVAPYLNLPTNTASNPGANQFSPLPEPNADSLPPIGGGKEGQFRYYTVTEMPILTNENWNFTIDGLVDSPAQYNWDQFLNLQRKVQVSDFHCVTGWSVYKGTWEGIPLKQFLDNAGIKNNAKYVKFYSADGVYTDTLTIDQAMMEDVMVATLLDGELLTQENGGPVRLLVPQMYAYKSVKWLNRIELIEEEHIGYWEERGYDTDAWVENV